ncbi:MAG TPA: hypothetical protein PLB01_00745 [Thermoanaerobaculia bacterium]|nr:hypothetical protein [Thermoanaerobaculia bacterium]
MRTLTLALALVFAAPRPLAADQTCVRTIGGRHIPAFVGLGSEGLDFQKRCLVWEYSAEPKAEFIPSPETPSLGSHAQVVVIEPAPDRSSGSITLSELLSHSLSLKPVASEAALSLMPAVSDAHPLTAK